MILSSWCLRALRSGLYAMAAAVVTLSAFAQNPLGLTPGTAANKVLGPIANPGAYDLTTGSSQISYNNTDLATRTYLVRLPAGFDPTDATKKSTPFSPPSGLAQRLFQEPPAKANS